MITVSAKALWWSEPKPCVCEPGVERDFCACDVGGWPAPMMFMEVDGWQYITDRYVLLPVARLTGLPVGYDSVLGLTPVPAQAALGMADWLDNDAHPDPSDRVFDQVFLDPLEQAGFRIRPMVGVRNVHAICAEDMRVVGLLNPVDRYLERVAEAPIRRAA